MATKTVKFEITVEGLQEFPDKVADLNHLFVTAVEALGLRCLILVEEVTDESEAQDERKAIE